MIRIAINFSGTSADFIAASERARALGADAMDWSGETIAAAPSIGELPIAVVDGGTLDRLDRALDVARAVGATWVRIPAPLQRTGESRGAAIMEFNRRLAPLADVAAENGLGVLIENANSFRAARDLWQLLDQLNHPAIACCWNQATAAAIGERPSLSVPTLNLRIAHVRLDDQAILRRDAEAHTLLNRLQGIGFNGLVSVNNLNPNDIELRRVIDVVREWTTSRQRKSVRGK